MADDPSKPESIHERAAAIYSAWVAADPRSPVWDSWAKVQAARQEARDEARQQLTDEALARRPAPAPRITEDREGSLGWAIKAAIKTIWPRGRPKRLSKDDRNRISREIDGPIFRYPRTTKEAGARDKAIDRALGPKSTR